MSSLFTLFGWTAVRHANFSPTNKSHYLDIGNHCALPHRPYLKMWSIYPKMKDQGDFDKRVSCAGVAGVCSDYLPQQACRIVPYLHRAIALPTAQSREIVEEQVHGHRKVSARAAQMWDWAE